MDGDSLKWRTLSSRIIVSDRWLTLRADTCETADRVRIDPYYVIEMRNEVVAVAITVDRNLVLVRQYRHGLGAVTLELPAGLMEPNEDPIAACRRELLEETGFSGGEASVLRSASTSPVRYSNRAHIILIQGVTKTAFAKDDPTERVETQLWPLDHAERLMFEPEFADLSLMGALASALAALKTEVVGSK